jgi:hypothetical protein
MLPVPPSHTTRQPSRTADNQGASNNSPGPQALNSLGATLHPTNGPDLTTSTGGTAGEDGEAQRHGRPPPPPAAAPLAMCRGTVILPDNNGTGRGQEPDEWVYPGLRVPLRATFFRDRDGERWVRFYFWARAPVTRPVTIEGDRISWVGEFGTVYTPRPSGDGHLSGPTSNLGPIDLTCVGLDTHPF